MNGPRNHGVPGESCCAAIEILLAEYQARELDPAEVALVESHLETCAECRGELAREKLLRGSLSDLPVVPCPDRVSQRIMAAIGAESASNERPSRSRRNLLVWASAAAAVVLLMTSPLMRNRDAGDQSQVAGQQFTQEEIQTARLDVQRSLLLTVGILNRTERSTVKEVFGNTLPNTLSRSIKSLINTPEGGQG